ncbi:hypothetical protein CRG98_033420 [Punica granatum]|uniref:Uncharacterized protein n=1 Tax=Punica granatum TaxID=22663 RepID=A0A2I0IQ73_PUNGR|nr:hypothetical protein CRG98_033420 [Punica granatum]
MRWPVEASRPSIMEIPIAISEIRISEIPTKILEIEDEGAPASHPIPRSTSPGGFARGFNDPDCKNPHRREGRWR